MGNSWMLFVVVNSNGSYQANYQFLLAKEVNLNIERFIYCYKKTISNKERLYNQHTEKHIVKFGQGQCETGKETGEEGDKTVIPRRPTVFAACRLIGHGSGTPGHSS
jgi:hypothetical protein